MLTDGFLETGQAMAQTGSPIWLDSQRLLFFNKVAKEPGGQPLPSTCIYYADSGEVKSLSFTGRSLIDKSNRQLYLGSFDRIIRTDFELTNPAVLAECNGTTRKMYNLFLEDGELIYAYRENGEMKLSKELKYIARDGETFRLKESVE